jgi:hypothetical protein
VNLADMRLADASQGGYLLTETGKRALADLRAARDAQIEANQRAYARHA